MKQPVQFFPTPDDGKFWVFRACKILSTWIFKESCLRGNPRAAYSRQKVTTCSSSSSESHEVISILNWCLLRPPPILLHTVSMLTLISLYPGLAFHFSSTALQIACMLCLSSESVLAGSSCINLIASCIASSCFSACILFFLVFEYAWPTIFEFDQGMMIWTPFFKCSHVPSI